MEDDFKIFKNEKENAVQWLVEEYMSIQSGKIAPSLLSNVQVRAYGATTPLSHCASIVVEGAKTLLITPYDTTVTPDIESAIQKHIPSIEVVTHGNIIRVIAPEITGERRALLEKSVKERMEDVRKSIRSAREKVLVSIKKKKANSEISEDEEFSAKQQLQEEVDRANKEIETLCEKKIEDIRV